MDTFTNPIGDPNTDFFKETLVEKILTEVENEVYWKLLRLPRDETPLLIDVYDTKTGFKKGWRHAPYCRCVFCPFNDLNYAKNLHKRKLSPFNDWNLDPTGNTIINYGLKCRKNSKSELRFLGFTLEFNNYRSDTSLDFKIRVLIVIDCLFL